ncbi:hypothetical protein AcV5_007264 [Taiwanofungus camphoratus]|nr:hypothetical protein AcV5_007264 [Antrodia cinnamomea]
MASGHRVEQSRGWGEEEGEGRGKEEGRDETRCDDAEKWEGEVRLSWMPGQASSVPRSAIRRPGSLTYARCTDARLLRTLFRLDRRGLPCPLRLSPTQSRSPQQPPAKAPTALAGGDNNDEDGDEDDDDNSNDSDTTTTAREQGDSARQHHSFAGSLSRAAASSTTADTSHTAVPFCSLPARPSPSSLSRVPLAGPCHWPRHPAARTSQQTPACPSRRTVRSASHDSSRSGSSTTIPPTACDRIAAPHV